MRAWDADDDGAAYSRTDHCETLTELNKLESHRCHTLLSKSLGAGTPTLGQYQPRALRAVAPPLHTRTGR